MAETMATLTTAVQDTKHTFGTAVVIANGATYTAPYDGYVVMQKSGAEINTWGNIQINTIQMIVLSTGAYQMASHLINSLFVRKGTSIFFSTNSTSSDTWAKFVPIIS